MLIKKQTLQLDNLVDGTKVYARNFFSLQTNKEIKGRLNVEQIEQHDSSAPSPSVEPQHKQQSKPAPPQQPQQQEQPAPPPTADDMNQSAFDLLVQSMKDAGQLPDKPAPVVSRKS